MKDTLEIILEEAAAAADAGERAGANSGQASAPAETVPAPAAEAGVAPGEAGPGATADGERLVLKAEREIVLQCGKASITLTRAGKVIIRGAYVLSRSSGVNRIVGGSVQIN